MKPFLKRILTTVAALSMLGLAACAKVPAGNVGVKFNLYGGDKGVQSTELQPGRYWVSWNQEVYTFPTFTQTYTWTRDSREGSKNDESISFQTDGGLTVDADIGITYHVNPDKVTTLFQTYRKGISEITHVYLRNMVRDALVSEASGMNVEAIYGSGKVALIKRVRDDVQTEVFNKGIVIEKINWIGQMRLPPNVVKAINAKIQATQMAQQRENEVKQAKAEAQKEVAKANGVAQSRLAIAEAEAKAIAVKGKALRENPEVIQLNMVEKWDGKLPRYQLGNSGSLVQLPPLK